MLTQELQLRVDDPVLGDVVFDARRCGPDSGEPVLLLHGWPQTSLEWSGVLPRLADAGCCAVAVDQRGYSPGVRPGETSAYELGHLVSDAVAFLDALGWESAHVVGHDWGAVVAWALAAQRPDRVRSLVAVSVPHPQAFNRALTSDPSQWAKSAYLAFFRMAPGKAAHVLLRDDAKALRAVYGADVDAADVARYVEHFSDDDAMLASLRWYAAMDGDKFRDVGPVSVPTTFLWGSADVAVGEQAARGCGEWCTGPFELRVLEGEGHWVPDRQPDAVAEAVLSRIG